MRPDFKSLLILTTLSLLPVLQSYAAPLQPATLAAPSNIAPPSTVSPVSEPKPDATVKFDYDPKLSPYLMVEARVNGVECGPFMVDTGSEPPLLLDSAVAARLHITPDGADAGVINQGTLSGKNATLKTFVLGDEPEGINYAEIEATVLDMSQMKFGNKPVAGIVGIPLLESFLNRIDFDAKKLDFFQKTEGFEFPKGSIVLPLSSDGHSRYTVPASVPGGAPVQMLLDTGSKFCILPRETAIAQAPSGRVSLIRRSVNAYYVVEELLLPKLVIGNAEITSVRTGIGANTEQPNFGLNLLSRYKVFLDFPKKKLVLSPRPGYHMEKEQNGYSGAKVIKNETGYVVDSVAEKSPASTAGLKPGEEVLSVNGQDLAGYSSANVNIVLSGLVGEKISVKLKSRDGHERSLSWTSGDPFKAPSNPLVGLTLVRREDGTLFVAGVEKGSRAEAKGLKPQDELVALNDVPVKDLAPPQVSYSLDRLDARLRVNRAGEALTF